MRVCVFVDGENLRFAIGHLFSAFDRREHLPKGAEWTGLYDLIVAEASRNKGSRLRTYWYVSRHFDPYPKPLNKNKRTEADLLGWATRHKRILRAVLEDVREAEMIARLRELQTELSETISRMRSRFEGFAVLQNGISKRHHAIEFRRSGAIPYNLITRKFGQEKTVDVNLAVDMVTLGSNYDLAVIVSGDQDYVPAAQAVKNMGKQVVNVAFQARNGKLLPGGAKQLNQTTDWSMALEWETLRELLSIEDERHAHNDN